MLRAEEEPRPLPSAVWGYAYSDNRTKRNKGLVNEAINSFGIIFQAEDDMRCVKVFRNCFRPRVL